MSKTYIRNIFITIVIVELLISLAGLTYSYFSLVIEGNDTASSVNLKTAQVGIEFESGPEIIADDITVSWEETIEFNIQNNSGIDIYYEIIWKDVINNLIDKENLVYNMTCESNMDTCEEQNETEVPGSSEIILTNIELKAQETHSYVLTMEYIGGLAEPGDFIGKVEIRQSDSE